MQGLIQFLSKHQAIFLFLLLEGLSLFLIVRFNAHQRNIFFTSANIVSGRISERFDRVTSFFALDEEVSELARENAMLRAQLQPAVSPGEAVRTDTVRQDSARRIYSYVPAQVISNSVNRENNYLTLALPEGHGVRAGMGVVSREGIVGIVQNTSRHYASVMSLLHRQCHISAAIHQKAIFGNLSWKQSDPQVLRMEDVPSHQTVVRGDRVETSGYSFIFPPGIPIGQVEEVRLPDGSYFFEIDVQLAANLARLQTVYIVRHEDLEELQALREEQF